MHVCKVAAEWRAEWGKDVVIDLVGGSITCCCHFIQSVGLSYVYSKQVIFELTQEWLKELSFSRLECGVNDSLQICVGSLTSPGIDTR